jgi:hypothetical protein
MMTNESLVRRYLLGDLPAEDRTRIEDEYFADSNRFEELVGAENDLIDSYARGTLSDSERRQFEQHYGGRPERRFRIDFAMALSQAALRERHPIPVPKASLWRSFQAYFQVPRPQMRWALASVAVLMMGVLVGLQNYRLRRDLQEAQTNSNQLRLHQDALRKQVEDLIARRQQTSEGEQSSQVARLEAPADLTFRLTAGALRGSGKEQGDLVIPQSRPLVRLEMVLDRDDYKTYQAALLTAEGSEILRSKALTSRSTGGSPVVAWRFPSDSIRSGYYVVRLSGKTTTGGEDDLASYSFRAVNK